MATSAALGKDGKQEIVSWTNKLYHQDHAKRERMRKGRNIQRDAMVKPCHAGLERGMAGGQAGRRRGWMDER